MLTIEKIHKTYQQTLVLDDISLALQPGQCFGLIGPNGAGKSTLMKIIVGIIHGDSGSISMHDEATDDWKNHIGYVPQEICLQDTITAEQNLTFFGELYGMERRFLDKRVQEVLHDIGLFERRKDKVGHFSGGMKRRLHIGCALLHEPTIIIMDEPTVGIDPQARQHIFNLIHTLKEKQCTIFYASHQIDEVEEICDEIAFMDKGKIILTDTLKQIIEQHTSPSLYVQWADDALPDMLKEWAHITKENEGWLIQTDTETRLDVVANIIEDAKARDAKIEQLAFTQNSLENIFFSLTGKALRD